MVWIWPVMMPWDIATLVITFISIMISVVIFVASFVIVSAAAYVYKNIWRAYADINPSLR